MYFELFRLSEVPLPRYGDSHAFTTGPKPSSPSRRSVSTGYLPAQCGHLGIGLSEKANKMLLAVNP